MAICLDPDLVEDESETVYISAVTESGSSTRAEAGGATGAATGGAELAVSVRLIEEGALVRWSRAPGDAARCTLRWYDAAEPEHRLLATVTTLQDYILGASEAKYYFTRSWVILNI